MPLQFRHLLPPSTCPIEKPIMTQYPFNLILFLGSHQLSGTRLPHFPLQRWVQRVQKQQEMPRELITIQVGQCGNQIGYRFWDLAFRQHSLHNKTNKYDDALSSFFRNTDGQANLQIGSQITDLKARAVIVDMEEGVINQMLKSELGQLFDQKQFINDVSGAGNNWAHGHCQYGPKYRNLLVQKIGRAVEQCDSLQSFFLMHSLGGGTGSGLGTYILGLLQQQYSDVFRFTASVFPSENDDVITSPYNSLLSLHQLMKHADCVLPIDNQALMNIVNEAQALKIKMREKQGKSQQPNNGKKSKAYDKMNNIIAHLLSNLTCSMRFEGILNVDFNEITMNLVPYPDLHFLVSSLAPLYSIIEPKLEPRRTDQIFSDVLATDHQLIQCNPKQNTYLAMGLILRGNISFSDVNRNIKVLRDRKDLNFVYWNSEGFKYGICNTPPMNQAYSALCLANNTCIQEKFEDMLKRFRKLYQKGLYVHHYEKYMQKSHFDEAMSDVQDIICKYNALNSLEPMKNVKRLKPLLL